MTDTNTAVKLVNIKNPSMLAWLKLPFTEDELDEALSAIGVSTAEGSDVSDFDKMVSGEPAISYYVAEWQSDYLDETHFTNIFAASDLTERIENLDSYDIETLDALLEDGDGLEEALDAIEDQTVTFYKDRDLATLAEEFGDEGIFPEDYLLKHVDWESIARDLEYDGYTEVRGGVIYRE